MYKKIYLFLGGILLLIVIVISFIFFIKARSSVPAQPAANNSGTFVTVNGNGSNSGNNPTATPTPNPVSNPTATPTPTPQPTSQPAANGLNQITDSYAVSPVLSYDSKLLWYFSQDGHLYNVNISTGLKQEYLLPTNFKVDNVIWPSIGNDFIVETDSGLGKTFYYYNSQAKNFINYPANVKEVDFMPDGTHVLYDWLDASGKGQLSLANFDLTAHKKIMDLPDSDDVVKVSPLRDRAFFYKNNTPADGKLYYVNLDTAKSFVIKTAGNNAVAWSADSSHFIYYRLGSDQNASSDQLWLGNLDANTDTMLGASLPLSKAAFDSTGRNLFIALPNQTGAGDSFWRIDTKTFLKNQFFSGANINASNLLVSNDGNTLYFKNKDNNVYSVPIKY
jgi:hypothetical protein